MKFFLLGLIALAIIVLVAVRLLRGRIPAGPTTAEGPPVPVIVRKITDIDAISIALHINKKQSLFIMLSADGTIKRMGTGTLENTEDQLFIGRSDATIFEAVRSHLTEAMLRGLGTYLLPNPRGAPCRLNIVFHFNDSTEGGLLFLYGAESEGPSSDVADLVTAAVRQSDSWYENFKRIAAQG